MLASGVSRSLHEYRESLNGFWGTLNRRAFLRNGSEYQQQELRDKGILDRQCLVHLTKLFAVDLAGKS
jgi:hypothetical protein